MEKAMGNLDPDMMRGKRIAVRIATDQECDDFVLQDHLQTFLRGVLCIVPYRRLLPMLEKAARRSGAALLDRNGQPARLADLSEHDYLAMDYWLRDFMIERPPHVRRRNRPETLERRRLLLTLARMVWPRETATWGWPLEHFGIEFTQLAPLDEDGFRA